MSENHQLGVAITLLEVLSAQFDWKIVKLLLRVHGVFDFLLGLLVRVGQVLGRVIAAAGLQSELLRALESDLEGVKAAIKLQILRREGQNIGIVRGLGCATKTFIEIVVVVKRDSSRTIG